MVGHAGTLIDILEYVHYTRESFIEQLEVRWPNSIDWLEQTDSTWQCKSMVTIPKKTCKMGEEINK